jgi:hypothetical protein
MSAPLFAALLAPVADDIRDIRGPVPLPQPVSPWVWVALAAVTALTLAAAWWWRRRRAKPLPPDVAALRSLEEARGLIGVGDAASFSSHVSETVRGYVESAFSVRAPFRTTEELLQQLLNDQSPVAAHRAELSEFLERCDLAKYARWSHSPDDMVAMLSSAEAFVRATAPSPGAR